jgi:hypothetical protein
MQQRKTRRQADKNIHAGESLNWSNGHATKPVQTPLLVTSLWLDTFFAYAVGSGRVRSTEIFAITTISRSMARSYGRSQGLPCPPQSLRLQPSCGTSIVAKFRRVSLVLHSRRKTLDELARAAAGAQSAWSWQTPRRDPVT